MTNIAPAQPTYLGANPVAYRIDADGTLRKASDPFSTGIDYVAGGTAVLTVAPQWFGAPPFFIGQGKPAAFCKIGVAQAKPLTPMAEPLTWSIVYSLLTAPNQDISTQSFTLSNDQAKALANIPLPGGMASFTCSLYAFVGGQPAKLFQIVSKTLQQLGSVADSGAAQALLIPAAEVKSAELAESLFFELVQQFEPPRASQYWMNTNGLGLVASADAAAAAAQTSIRLAAGVNNIVLVPASGNPGDHVPGKPDAIADYFHALDAFVGTAQTFSLDPNGIHTVGESPNPFDTMPYVACTFTVQAAT